jgi:F-type H+-transporting ATPase subunit epsilon
MIVNVVSPEEEYFSGESTMVVTRTPNGEIGIYSGHEATVATILPGGLTIEHSGGKDSYAVSGGLLQITPEKVTVLGEIIEKIDGDHEAAIVRGKELLEALTEQDT